ncbi:MAG: Ig-like domain-containing protein [Candidatus Promineifilaceae bacterium]
MSRRRFAQLVALLLVLPLLFSACRKEEEPTPTVAPQPTVTDQEEAAPESQPTTAVETPAPVINYDWPPQVIYHSPEPGQEAMLNGAITVRFDQPMDKGSVEAAFSIAKSGQPGQVNGFFNWPRSDTLVFTPVSGLDRQEQYDVHIADTAAAENGLPLRASTQFQVETVGFLEVSQVIPEPGGSDVQTDAAITVMFNRPVVPLVATGQQADLPDPLVIEPAVEGQGDWVSTSIYRFLPDSPLGGATDYQVTVAAGLEDITGGELAESFIWRFTTLSPSIVTIEPELDGRPFVPDQPITVTFNMPMNRAATESAITLEPEAPIEYDWSENGRVVTLTPELDLATDYQLTVDNSARSQNGQATLDELTTYTFSSVPFPTVLETMPANGATSERWQRGFSIHFASPMDIDTLDGQIVIEPDPGDVNYYFDDYNFYLSADFELDRNTTYQITVPASAADRYGNTMGEDYTWRFTTPGFDPLVSMNLPNVVSQLSRSHPSNIDVIYRNVDQFDANLYDLGLPVETLNAPYLTDFAPLGDPIKTWSIAVEQQEQTADVYSLPLADGGVLPNGVYFLTTTAPQIIEQSYWQMQDAILIVADTNLVVKEMVNQIHVWATDLANGQPAPGRSLTFYDYTGAVLGTATTDNNGLASIDYQPTADYLQGVLVTSNEPGQTGFGVGSSIWNQKVTPWEFGLNTQPNDEPARYAYLYTDRPIYRPGDTVHFKGIVRDTNFGRYPLPTNQNISLNMTFLNNYEEVPFNYETTLDANGEFSGEYQIPDDAQLGNYQFYFDTGDIQAQRSFTVAQYRRPEFQVTATADQDQALRGETVDVVVDASYFFGGPATDLEVNWTIYEENYTLPWDGPYYSFGDNGGYFYEASGPFNFGAGGVYGNWLQSGTGKTDGQGRLVIEVPADLLDDLDPGSRQISVEATVQDISNFPITARTSFVLHEAETYVGVVAGDYVSAAGTSTDINVITVGWDQRPVANTDVDLTIYKREWLPVRDVQYSIYYTRWEAVDTEVEQLSVTTDGQGKGTAEFVPSEGGSYIILASVTDDNGRTQLSSTSLWATDANFIGWGTDNREKRMDLVADQQAYNVGDTARILVQSPFAGPTKAWLTIERGEIIDQSVVTLNGSSDVLEIPITGDFAPNVFVTVHAVKGTDANNEYADMRIGMIELVVAPDQLDLNVSLMPQKDVLEPRDTAVYDIEVTDSEGNPVQSDLSLALVDLAVLTLKEDNAPPIAEDFYQRQPIRSQTGAGLIYSAEGLDIEVPLEAGGLGGGGGGEAEASRTFSLEDEDDARRDFPDTAFWEATLTTDEDGHATVEIPLPDTATTWRLSSKAVSQYNVTGETLVGQSSVDVVATLPVLVRPVTPRFLTVGDSLLLGAIVHNNTGSAIEMTVSLDAEGLTLQGDAEQTADVPANGSQLIQWPVVVDDVEFADLTFTAEGGGFHDATKPGFGVGPDQLLPVTRFTGQDIVGTSGVLNEVGRRVEAILLPPNVDQRQGEVTIQVSGSLAGALTQALDYLNSEDTRTACAHAITNQLLPNVATFTALQTLNLEQDALAAQLEDIITQDVKQLELLQKTSGAWGWCYSDQLDPYLSAYSLLALLKSQEAGFTVSNRVVEQAAAYLQTQITPANNLDTRTEANRQAFFLYVLAEAGTADPNDAEDLFSEQRGLMDPYAKAFLALALDLSGGSAANRGALLGDLNDTVILDASGAHWEDEIPDWNNLSSDIRGTAIVLDALVRLNADNLMAPNTVRWLMSSRTADHWATDHENAWSILALTDWMAATGELNAEFTYQIAINGAPLTDSEFDRSNITDSESYNVPVSDLLTDDVNFLDFQHGAGVGSLYYTAYLNSFISADNLSAVNRGVVVQRTYYDAACDLDVQECQPITSIEAGDMVRVELTIIVPNDLTYAIVEDHFPAGAEAIDPGLETSVSGAGGSIEQVTDNSYRYGYWGWWYFNNIEYRDDRVVFLSDFLPAGTYQYSYTLQTTIAGEYQVLPAVAYQEFFPDVFGRSDGFIFTIER